MTIKPVGQWTDTNYNTQTGTAYPLQIDSNLTVSKRFADCFAPHAAASPNMTMGVDAGWILNTATNTVLEVAAQSTGTFTAPVTFARIDRVVADKTTGVISVVTGTEASSPVPPSVPSGKMPVAQVTLQTTSLLISNAMIADERALWALSPGGGFTTQASVSSASTTDLGAAGSNNIFINGTTSISSFGSSANIAAPVYLVEFGGSLTLVNSGSLLLPGNANVLTQPNDALLAIYLGSGVWRVFAYFAAINTAEPAGTIKGYGGTTAPGGYYPCDGGVCNTSTDPGLFNNIGYNFGGAGTAFNRPDYRGRVIFGFDSGNATGRLTKPVSQGIDASGMGNTGGEQTHTQTNNEMFPHNHATRGHLVIYQSGGASGACDISAALSDTTSTNGGGAAFNVVPPGGIALWIIKR